MNVSLCGLATALPEGALCQDFALDWKRRKMEGQQLQTNRMEALFHNTGIERRYCVAELDWFESSKTWQERNDIYLEAATDLFIKAAIEALEDAQWNAQSVDAVVTVSSTGLATPTLEARAFSDLGLRHDILRVPLFGLGCAGGVSGLAIARDLALAGRRRVLLVAVETCTVQFRASEMRKADIVAAALFGDGAAAACISGDPADLAPETYRIGVGGQQIWPDTLSIMGWNVHNEGFDVVFDRSIPPFVEEHFSNAMHTTLGSLGSKFEDFDRLVCHPGGAKVLTAFEKCLDLPAGSLDIEREVLRDFGNMSAPTVLFVLKKVLAARDHDKVLMAALGPGFTASFLPMEIM